MYQAKAAGRNTFRFYDPRMQAALNARSALEVQLRLAIAQQQFVLYYQAQVNARRDVVGVEALVRWQHPERGLVAPDEFIQLAEEIDQMVPLGGQVMQMACRQLFQWARHPATEALCISVNVSARQFRAANFVRQVANAVNETGANPLRLKLELTESMLIDNVDDVARKMKELKGLGISFSLDDFGTGYSSLAYLKRLPFDQIKLDQSFVRDILSDPNDAAIARTVVALGKSLGLDVIAEGVENEAQREFLASNGCMLYQGYLFSRPVPPNAFEKFIGL
jgi:EAL domain-containing protein (putative c-di-GMP-specific phosphodiesterase class I)